MSVALKQEERFAIGFKQQTDLVTALTAANMISLRGTQIDFQAQPINQYDTLDLGKGVYTEQVFPESIRATGTWNGRLTSEAAAIISAFGIGAAAKASVTPGFSYTMTAPDLSV